MPQACEVLVSQDYSQTWGGLGDGYSVAPSSSAKVQTPFVDLPVPQLGPCFSGAGRPLLPRCRIFSFEAIRPRGESYSFPELVGSSSKAWPLWREGNCDMMGKTVTRIDSRAPPTALRDGVQHRMGLRPGHCRASRAGWKCRAPVTSRLLLKR